MITFELQHQTRHSHGRWYLSREFTDEAEARKEHGIMTALAAGHENGVSYRLVRVTREVVAPMTDGLYCWRPES